MALTQKTFDNIGLYIQSLPHFITDVNTLLKEQVNHLSKLISLKTSESTVIVQGKHNTEGFLLQLFTYIQRNLIGIDNTSVHFRIENNRKYTTFMDASYPFVGLSTEPISGNNGLIKCSNDLQAPVIKRYNLKLHRQAHPNETVNRDYITFTFDEISKLYNVNVSMCISAIGSKAKKCKDMFIPMAIFRFEKNIETFIIQYFKSCSKLNTKYNVKKILMHGGNK